VSQPDPAPGTPSQDPAAAATNEMFGTSMRAFGQVVERITPWLIDFGGWIFAGLIALIFLIVPSLITVGPVDVPITLATVTFALALPLDVSGLIMLKLIQDIDRIGLTRELTQAFREAGFPAEAPVLASVAPASHRPSGTQIALLYSLVVLVLSVLLILTGLVAALWHMAWWIAVAFLAMLIVSLGSAIAAFALLRLPDTPEARARQRRYWDELVRQAQAQGQAYGQAQPPFLKKEGGP
jgi:hypothetical protein